LLSYNQVALGNGDGTFTPLPGLTSTIIETLAHVNNDGTPDLIVNLNFGQKWRILLGKGDGSFGLPLDTVIPNSPIMVADMNGDGRPDLIFFWAGGLGVMLNTTSPYFEVSATITSNTITAGQMAKFTLLVMPSGQFTGTVNLSCDTTAAVTPGPTCSLSSSSVQMNGGKAQSVTVTVATTGQATTGVISLVDTPLPGAMVALSALFLTGWGLRWQKRRLVVLATPLMALVLASSLSCGVSGNPPSIHISHGTPSGTYTATVTATSGAASAKPPP
jgi:hypothetical protein